MLRPSYLLHIRLRLKLLLDLLLNTWGGEPIGDGGKEPVGE